MNMDNSDQFKRIMHSKLLLPVFIICLIVFSFNGAWAGISSYFDTVQKTYIGYYQRPADPSGLIYWANRLSNSAGNLNEIIEAFANSPESGALYGTINSGNISSVVNGIYRALFGRDAEAVGLNYYVNGFNSGRFTAATIMLNVLYGAQNEDLQSLNNKVTAANLFTRTIDPELDGANPRVTYAGNTDAQKARDFLSTVTSNSGTVPTQADLTAWIRDNIADAGDLILGLTISSLSTTSAAPMKMLTITGTGFDPASELAVSFFNNNGFQLDVPVLVATTSSITVAVPPYINPSTGMFEPGTVNIRVLQNSTGGSAASNTLTGFQIGSLPTLTLPPGSVTANVAGFLELSITDTINRLLDFDTSSAGQINTVDLRAKLESIRIQFGQLKSKIRNAIANPGQAETIGGINGVPISLDQASLEISDRLMVAMINETLEQLQVPTTISKIPKTKCPPGAFASYAFNPTNVSPICDTNPQMCNAAGEPLLTVKNSITGEETGVAQYEYAMALPGASETLGEIGKWFAATTASLGAVIVAAGGTIPLAAVAVITQVNVELMVGKYGMDASMLSINSADKEAAKRLVDDFNGTLEFMRDSVLSPTIAAISERAGILYDLYTGWKPIVEDKAPVFLTQLKTFIDVAPPPCTYTYSAWSTCQPNNTQTRTVISSSPPICTGTPVLSQSCTYTPAVCGDGICDAPGGENGTNCPSDCTAYCGDGICSPGESITCPEDCQTSPCCISTNNCPGETLYECGETCCCCPYGSRCSNGACSN